MLRHLTDALIAWGPAGILVLAIIDSSGVPVAGVFDALLVLISVERPGAAWICAALAIAGSTVGNSVLFLTARQGGRKLMQGARPVMQNDGPDSPPSGRAARFRQWFRRYGLITVFVPALVPIPMPLKLFVISAGALGTPAVQFIAVILAARTLRYGGEAWLGITLGRESAKFLQSHAWHFVAGAILLFVILYLYVVLRDRRRTSANL